MQRYIEIMPFVSTVITITSLLLCSPVITYAIEKGEFRPPNLEGYILVEKKTLDKDTVKDGIKETKLEIYMNAAGQKIGKYSTYGKTLAWVVKSARDVNDKINNDAVRDSNGDSIFDEWYLFVGEEFYLPDWVK